MRHPRSRGGLAPAACNRRGWARATALAQVVVGVAVAVAVAVAAAACARSDPAAAPGRLAAASAPAAAPVATPGSTRAGPAAAADVAPEASDAGAGAAARPDAGPSPPPPPAPPRPPKPGDLVDVARLEPGIRLDIRYATADNFTGEAVYPAARCLLRRAVAERLARVHRALARRGLGLLVWDCYRPISVQQALWRLVPDPRYVARPVVRDGVPVSGSRHNRGAAVDLTLVRAGGGAVEMPTDYDDFSPRAHRGDRRASPEARANAAALSAAMEAEGFEPLATEWWHFDAPGWRDYPLSDEPL